jgi:hypothetical protein
MERIVDQTCDEGIANEKDHGEESGKTSATGAPTAPVPPNSNGDSVTPPAQPVATATRHTVPLVWFAIWVCFILYGGYRIFYVERMNVDSLHRLGASLQGPHCSNSGTGLDVNCFTPGRCKILRDHPVADPYAGVSKKFVLQLSIVSPLVGGPPLKISAVDLMTSRLCPKHQSPRRVIQTESSPQGVTSDQSSCLLSSVTRYFDGEPVHRYFSAGSGGSKGSKGGISLVNNPAQLHQAVLLSSNLYFTSKNTLLSGEKAIDVAAFLFEEDANCAQTVNATEGKDRLEHSHCVRTGSATGVCFLGIACRRVSDEGNQLVAAVTEAGEAALAALLGRILGIEDFSTKSIASFRTRHDQFLRCQAVHYIDQLSALLMDFPEVPFPANLESTVAQLTAAVDRLTNRETSTSSSREEFPGGWDTAGSGLSSWAQVSVLAYQLYTSRESLPNIHLPFDQKLAVLAPLFAPMVVAVLSDLVHWARSARKKKVNPQSPDPKTTSADSASPNGEKMKLE